MMRKRESGWERKKEREKEGRGGREIKEGSLVKINFRLIENNGLAYEKKIKRNDFMINNVLLKL